jgi:large subunit ribosomal protein L19
MQKIQEFNQKVRGSIQRPELHTGDIIKVHRKITEGNKERVQVFEGIVIAIKGKQSSSPMVTVRRVSFNVGVEITIPLYSPVISKIELVKRAKVRRSKLYYLRKKGFRLSKLKMKELDRFVAKEEAPEEKKEETITVEKNEVEKKTVSEGK